MRVHQSVYIVDGMCCADEQRVIEKHLRTVEGIETFSFNLVARKLTITHSLPESDIPPIIKRAGFTACPLTPSAPRAMPHRTAGLRSHVSTFIALGLTALGIVCDSIGLPTEISRPILIFAIVVGGWKTALKAWAGLRTMTFDMNVLMSAAVLGAAVLGRWNEAAAVIALFALAQLLEDMSMERTRRAIALLIESAPPTASRVTDGVESTVDASMLHIDDRVKIRPGEKIPADGVVLLGHSFVNEAAITGEPLPSEKIPGSPVYAGTLNERGMLEVAVTRTGDDTTLARIIHLVEQAQSERAPAQRFIDRFSAVYSPSIMALACLAAVIPPFIFHADAGLWIYRALVLLVIACPCALVISTPVSIISGLTAAARHGILIKGGRILETASRVRVLAFDKTGTLTYGTPEVTEILALNGLPDETLIRLAALGEQHSEHVLADAVMRKAAEMRISLDDDRSAAFEAIPGRGIAMTIDGVPYRVGSRIFLEEEGIDLSDVRERLDEFERGGKTVIGVASRASLLGVIAVADRIRKESRDAVALFHTNGIDRTVLLSGDNAETAQRVARELGIHEASGGLHPEEKVDAVKRLRERFGETAMIGDGINDAPALAAASVGIAIGNGGTDAAMETADVVLMKNDLRALNTLFHLSRRTMRVLRQNVAIALGAKALFLVLGLAGIATLWMAVVADDGVTLLVVMNSLRLLNHRRAARSSS